MTKRVGIIALQHESNTFLATPTTWEQFEQGALLTGADIRREYGAAHHEVGGFFEGLDEFGIEPVPIFLAWAMPGGIVTDQTYQRLLRLMLAELAAAGPLDAVLVAPHGAAVSERHADMDGAWLGELRRRLGNQRPIVGTLDLHANLSPAMVAACDALIAYRSNPHLDQRQRGQEAAHLVARTLRGEVRPAQAAAFPPVVINIERQLTSEPPCRQMYAALDQMLARPEVLSYSALLGFPYADVEELGSSFLVVTDGKPELAQALANEMADLLINQRHLFVGQWTPIEAAVDRAATQAGPVCLLDMGDNVGGGSPGDGTLLLAALAERKTCRAFVAIYDPAAAAQAFAAGTGNRLSLSIGGKTDVRHGPPITAAATVRSLHEGKFSEEQPRHGGKTQYNMGPTAIVELDEGPTVMLTSLRMAPFSLSQLTSCAIDPRGFQIIVAKGVHAPLAAYAPVCPTIIRVSTPGVTTADLAQLDYHHRRRPLFPFEEI